VFKANEPIKVFVKLIKSLELSIGWTSWRPCSCQPWQ